LKRFTLSLIEQIDTLSRIAGEFATFARMPKTQAENVNLYEMLVNMQQLHANDSGATITFKPDTVPPCMVIADKEQLLRVFNNLIKNAIQAIPEDKEGKIVLGIERKGSNYVATVTDNGNGIPEELHDKIFTPNFTTKTSGMGLGLAIVKSIVDSSGGNIRFETTEGKGSAFYVELPAVS
jgi:signal transduction histidine kinase